MFVCQFKFQNTLIYNLVKGKIESHIANTQVYCCHQIQV